MMKGLQSCLLYFSSFIELVEAVLGDVRMCSGWPFLTRAGHMETQGCGEVEEGAEGKGEGPSCPSQHVLDTTAASSALPGVLPARESRKRKVLSQRHYDTFKLTQINIRRPAYSGLFIYVHKAQSREINYVIVSHIWFNTTLGLKIADK